MNSIVPEQILFTDNEGNHTSLDAIIDDGLDGAYQDRIPALIELLDSGSPLHKLLACNVLTSWGCKEGFEKIVLWASNPNEAPWSQSPVSFDRLYGADDAFENLAGALKTSYWNASNSELVEMQRKTAEALLEIYSDSFFDRTLALALLKDSIWKNERKDTIIGKLSHCISQMESGTRADFDLSYQTASLLFVLAPVDDKLTAFFAHQLIALCNDNLKPLKEIIAALATASGSDTLKTLQTLSESKLPSISEEARKAMNLRTRL